MPRSIVHLDSRNADGDIARGMSWPLGAASIAQTIDDPAIPEIWLQVTRHDRVKEWSRGTSHPSSVEPLNPDAPVLVAVAHDKRRIRLWIDSHQRSSWLTTPPWMSINPSPLVDASVYSLPTDIMRRAGLTRARTAAALQSAFDAWVPRPLTCRDWRITLALDRETKEVIASCYERPIRLWTLASQHRME